MPSNVALVRWGCPYHSDSRRSFGNTLLCLGWISEHLAHTPQGTRTICLRLRQQKPSFENSQVETNATKLSGIFTEHCSCSKSSQQRSGSCKYHLTTAKQPAHLSHSAKLLGCYVPLNLTQRAAATFVANYLVKKLQQQMGHNGAGARVHAEPWPRLHQDVVCLTSVHSHALSFLEAMGLQLFSKIKRWYWKVQSHNAFVVA